MTGQLDALNQVIEEGNEIEQLTKSRAWEILRRTILAQITNYRSDCYDAAKDATKNLGNYLGRMEGLEWLLSLVERDFAAARDGALAERQNAETLAKQQAELDRGVAENLGTPVFQKPGMV